MPHVYAATVTAPTCLAQGYTTYKCNTCEDSYVANYQPAKGHNHQAVVTDPTCTEQGYTTHKCADCGDTYLDTYVAPKGHTYGEWYQTKAPTCTLSGTDEQKCSCGATQTRVVNAIGHKYTAVTTAPTCDAKGYTTYTCQNANCGASYVDNYVNALGHNYVVTWKWYIDNTTEPTVVVTVQCANHAEHKVQETLVPNYKILFDSTDKKLGLGEYSVQFEFGGVVYTETRTQEIATHDHDDSQWKHNDANHWYQCSRCAGNSSHIPHNLDLIEEVAATCESTGKKVYECKCGYTRTEITPKTENHTVSAEVYRDNNNHWNVCLYCGEKLNVTAHTWNDGIVTKAPTCTETGILTKSCICGAVSTEVLDKDSTNHSGSKFYAYDDAQHWYAYNCCNATEEAKNHKFAQTITKAPTCTEKGIMTYTCECGKTYTEEIDATGHKTVVVLFNETEHWSQCTVCGNRVGDTVEHTLIETTVTAPTCVNSGRVTVKCDCGYQYTETTDPTGHTYTTKVDFDANGHWFICDVCQAADEQKAHTFKVIVTAPTCTKQGYTTYECDCGYKFVADYTDALGHTEVIISAKDATCTESGLTEGKKCSVCNIILVAQEVIPEQA